jgi:hypothetical protein
MMALGQSHFYQRILYQIADNTISAPEVKIETPIYRPELLSMKCFKKPLKN